MNKDNVHTSSVKRAFNTLAAAMDLAKIRKLSGGAVRIVLLLLSCTTNNAGDVDNLVCRTSLDYLQTHSGFCERQVRNLLREVESLGIFVLVDKGRNIPVKMTNTWVYDDKRIAELAKPTKETWHRRCDERDNDDQIAAVRSTIAKRQNIAELRKNISEPTQDVSAFPNSVAPSLGVSLGAGLDLHTYKQTTAAPIAFASPSLPEVAPLPTPTAAVRAVPVQPEQAPVAHDRKHHLTDEQVNDMLAAFDAKWTQITGFQGTRLHGPKDRSNVAYVGRKCSEVAKSSNVDIMAVYKQALRSLERVYKQRNENQAPITDPTAYFKKALGSLTLTVTAPTVTAETPTTPALVPARRQPVDVSLNSDRSAPRTRPHQPAVTQNSTVNAPVDVATSEHDKQHHDTPTTNVDASNAQLTTGRELSMNHTKRLIDMMTKTGDFNLAAGLARTSSQAPYRRAAVA